MMRPGPWSALLLLGGLALLQVSVVFEQYLVFAVGMVCCVSGVLLGVQSPPGRRCNDRACPEC